MSSDTIDSPDRSRNVSSLSPTEVDFANEVSTTPSKSSPYSPPRQQIPRLPVPENMDIQLRPTIPNSKRKFDINRLAFSGGESTNSMLLDELKVMLESIQDALVNIVERSKGNSSHIKVFGSQLKVFNETFRKRQENEEDLLTASVFKSGQQDMTAIMNELMNRVTNSNDTTAVSKNLESLKNVIESLSKAIRGSVRSEDVIESQLKTLREDLIKTTDQTVLLNEIKQAICSQNFDESFNDLKSSILGLQAQEGNESNSVDLSAHMAVLKDDLSSLKNRINDISLRNAPIHEEIQKVSEICVVLNEQNVVLLDKLEAIVAESGNRQEQYEAKIVSLQNQLEEKNRVISDMKSEVSLQVQHDHEIQKLRQQVKDYEAKESLQLSLLDIFTETANAKTVSAKIEARIHAKDEHLKELSTAYNAKLDAYKSLSTRFEELKAKTDLYLSLRPERSALNTLNFDLKSSLPSADSEKSNKTSSVKAKKRNVTLNENMFTSLSVNHGVQGNTARKSHERAATDLNGKENVF